MARLLLIGLVGAALLVCSSAPALAAPIVADDFSYPDGPLAGRDGGTGGPGSSWTTAWAESGWNVSGGQVTASDYTYSERSFSTGFSGSPATPFLYFSARVRVPEGDDGNYAGPYLVEGSTWNGLCFGLMRGLDEPGVLQPFVWGWGGSGEAYATAGSCTAGQEVLIVGKLEFNTGGGGMEQLQIWVDPTNVETSTQYSTPIIVDLGWTTPDLVSLENGTAGASYMDDVRIGTTWADVGPVPEPSTLLLLAMGLLGLLCYAWRKRK